MAKNETVTVAEAVAEAPVAEAKEFAATPVLSVKKENLLELAKAFSDVAGYYTGSKYEFDRDDGLAVLSKYGVSVSE